MGEPRIILYQTEWCPFSSAVREVLTELGLDAVIRQVEPWPEQRDQLRAIRIGRTVLERGKNTAQSRFDRRPPW